MKYLVFQGENFLKYKKEPAPTLKLLLQLQINSYTLTTWRRDPCPFDYEFLLQTIIKTPEIIYHDIVRIRNLPNLARINQEQWWKKLSFFANFFSQ